MGNGAHRLSRFLRYPKFISQLHSIRIMCIPGWLDISAQESHGLRMGIILSSLQPVLLLVACRIFHFVLLHPLDVLVCNLSLQSSDNIVQCQN